ncbi:hypothetical protein BB8028_0009g00030 [Beauveria bassiana]|uniref:Uncharacterized protein n=1 Tax=Beauveria bassiana TaxID=176275 RepID=A0A2S7YNT0_BEABA|nr:hypothetical protein BB8028_0009g00030 [Beauveria bassiana]
MLISPPPLFNTAATPLSLCFATRTVVVAIAAALPKIAFETTAAVPLAVTADIRDRTCLSLLQALYFRRRRRRRRDSKIQTGESGHEDGCDFHGVWAV